MTTFSPIEEAIDELKNGKIIIVTDDENRENEGDLVCAGEFSTPENINFMARFGRGLICVSIDQERAKNLDLPLMVKQSTAKLETAFTVSIDAVIGTTTGISALDRSTTILKLTDDLARHDDFAQPGHIFPLIAKNGGVFTRQGHTEAAIDLMNLAGLKKVGTICEILNDDGTMARVPELKKFAATFNLKMINIKDLIEYRKKHEILIHHEAEVDLPTQFGSFKLHIFTSKINPGEHHLAIVKGQPDKETSVLCRIHSECLTGDVLSSNRCDCGEQLNFALREIAAAETGVVLYMRQEGRGIGLLNKIRAYELQDMGYDTVEANHQLGFKSDLREYYFSAQMLAWFSIGKVKLLTNNPDKIDALKKAGIEIIERIPIEIPAKSHNRFYLETKKDRMGHILKVETE